MQSSSKNIDLIKLETNSSYELEDLDPLNQDAKPLPPPVPPLSTHPNHLGLNNPLYPFVQPMYTQNRSSTYHYTPDDDNDLLRQYGLDKFPVRNEQRERTNSSDVLNNSSTSRLSNSKTDWIQFD